MRRSAVLAILLVLAVGGVAQAKPLVASVNGTYTYLVDPDTGSSRTISLSARDSDPVKGTWTRAGVVMTGTVTCLRVAGADAWLAGPVTSGGTVEAVFMWVHDAGAPGWAGDTAFTWFSDPGETLADMEALCVSMTTSPYGFDPFPVVSGNVTVHLAR